jgi:mannose/fructose/N-acetylgalactosamine-specific phosphotransferase system component IID
MNLPLRIIIVTVIAITVTDSVVYFHLKQHPESLTIPFLIELIFITILPIALTLLMWCYQQSKKQH